MSSVDMNICGMIKIWGKKRRIYQLGESDNVFEDEQFFVLTNEDIYTKNVGLNPENAIFYGKGRNAFFQDARQKICLNCKNFLDNFTWLVLSMVRTFFEAFLKMPVNRGF